ncbi:MAG TPA: hypothetical protein VK017_14315 [Sphingobacterium sp.]|nr:hypothetical protein [Sphingobacterium sp.]
MKRLTNLRSMIAIVAAASLMHVGALHAQEKPVKKLLPAKTKPVAPPRQADPLLPDSNAFTKKVKKSDTTAVEKLTGEKHNGFDVFMGADKKRFYIDKKGNKQYLPEK